MTIKAKDIINKSRFTLSDSARDRWTDERLLSLLNDGIVDMAKHTTLFVKELFYTIQNEVVDLDFSPVMTKLVRAEYLDKPLPIKSFEEMDKEVGKGWQLERGSEAKALVYNKQRGGLYKLYPIVENAQNDLMVFSGEYGIITHITYSDIAPIVTGTFGDLAGVPANAIIKLYHVPRHIEVTDINTILDIDELTRQPLIHYVTGMAMMDNQDTVNLNMANSQLGLYSTMIEKYGWEKEQGFVRTPRSTPYNPMGA